MMDKAYKTKNKTKKICVKKKENEDFYKKVAKKFGSIKKTLYLCTRFETRSPSLRRLERW